MELNKELLHEALEKVKASYDDKEMPVGDEVLVVFDDCSILYTMQEGRHLKIEICQDVPIVVKGNLFKVE